MHGAQTPHLLFALFLLFQQLLLTGDIAAIALGQHVLSHGLDGLTGDDLAADGSLDGDLKELSGDVLLQLLTQPAGAGVRLILMGNKAEGVHTVAVELHVHLDQHTGPVAGKLVVQRGIPLGVGLQGIKEIVNDLIQRHQIMQLHQTGIQILHILEFTAAVLAHRHDVAHILVGRNDRSLDIRLLRVVDVGGIRIIVRVIHANQRSVILIDIVDNGGQRGDQVQIELPLQALLDDLHMKHTQEAAAETEAQCHRGFRLKGQRRVIQLQLLQRVTQVGVLGAILGIDAAVDHGLHRAVAGQRFRCRIGGVGDGITYTGIFHVLDGSREVTDLAGL